MELEVGCVDEWNKESWFILVFKFPPSFFPLLRITQDPKSRGPEDDAAVENSVELSSIVMAMVEQPKWPHIIILMHCLV